jgi:hypothetical protein
MTHAMLFTSLAVVDNTARLWRVENSWAPSQVAARERAPFAARFGEVDLRQRSAAAVEEALALHAKQEADGLVEPTGRLELLWRVLKVHPVAVVVV